METDPTKMSRFELLQFSKYLAGRRTDLERKFICWQALTRALAAISREYAIENVDLSSWCTKQTFKAVEYERKLTVEITSTVDRHREIDVLLGHGQPLDDVQS